MTDQIITALKSAKKRIRTDYQESLKHYYRLDRKSRTDIGLDFDETEQDGFEDGFSAALRLALEHFRRELSAIGVKLKAE